MGDTMRINLEENEIMERKVPKDVPSSSVFQYPYTWKSWRGFWRNLIYFFRCLRPAWHRATKGYCTMDTWSADLTICTYLIRVLTEYRNVTNGWPDTEFATYEEWITYIDEIIDLLIFAIEDEDKLNKYHAEWSEKCCNVKRNEWTEEHETIWKNYLAEVQKIADRQNGAREKAFAMLGKYLPHIWW